MSFSLVSNAYLDHQSDRIRSKSVPWEGYQRAGLITTDELVLLKRVDRQPKARIDSILLSDGQSYALLYLRLLDKLQRADTIQCILVYITDVLLGKPRKRDERISLFTRASETDPELPYGALLRALDSQDDIVQLKAAQILTVLLSSETTPIPPKILQPFLNTLSSFLTSSSPHKRDLAVQCMEALLPRREVRKAVWGIPQII